MKVKCIPADSTINCVHQVSATGTMILNKNEHGLSMPVIARCGWEYDKESMIFHYYSTKMFMLKAGT